MRGPRQKKASDVTRAIIHLRLTKCVGPDKIPNFLINSCYEVFTPLLSRIFNLALLTGNFPSLWKHAAVVSIFKKGNRAPVINCRLILILNNLSKIFLKYCIRSTFF
jgi:hypothetical protein